MKKKYKMYTENDIVISLKLAKKLKKAGWINITAFYAFLAPAIVNDDIGKRYTLAYSNYDLIKMNRDNFFSIEEIILMPTFQEIYEDLIEKTKLRFIIEENTVFVYKKPLKKEECFFRSKSLVDSAAKTWIWCKKNGYMN